MIRSQDVDLKLKRVYIKKFKGHAACWKPLVPSVLAFLQKAKQHGIKNRAGDVWRWPEQGFFFPSRRGASKKHMQKDPVCHMISKVRKTFLKKYPHYKGEKAIKSHSGRRHAISSFAGGGLSADVGMIFAQITSFRIYQKYIDAEPQQVARQMKAFDRQNRVG